LSGYKTLSKYFEVLIKKCKSGYIEFTIFPKDYIYSPFQTVRFFDYEDNLLRYENTFGDWINYYYENGKRVKEIHSCGYIKDLRVDKTL
jgi:hypothetical protein